MTDDLKDIWNAYSKQQEAAAFDQNHLRELLKGKSDNAIDRLRKNVKWELSAAIIVLLLFPIAYYFSDDAHLRVALAAFGFLSLGYTFYFYQKSVFLRNIHLSTDTTLKSSLADFVQQLERFVKFYYYGYLVLVPITSTLGYIFGFYLSLKEETLRQFLANPLIVITGILSLIALSGLFHFVLKWYIYRLFGVYLERLKGYLKDLEE
ncbi:MAG: hypothetical protein ACKVTZ_10650 [Bacteroidia bacterium]